MLRFTPCERAIGRGRAQSCGPEQGGDGFAHLLHGGLGGALKRVRAKSGCRCLGLQTEKTALDEGKPVAASTMIGAVEFERVVEGDARLVIGIAIVAQRPDRSTELPTDIDRASSTRDRAPVRWKGAGAPSSRPHRRDDDRKTRRRRRGTRDDTRGIERHRRRSGGRTVRVNSPSSSVKSVG